MIMDLFENTFNISGEIVKYYNWAMSKEGSRSFAIKKAMKDYGMSRTRIMNCDYEIKKIKAKKQMKVHGNRYEASGTCKCGMIVWNDDCYYGKGWFECSECHTSGQERGELCQTKK
jgi:hypothetical protein